MKYESVIPKKEIDHLAEALRNQTLTDEEADRLRTIIRKHPRARRRLVEHLYLSGILRDERYRWEHVGLEEKIVPIREEVEKFRPRQSWVPALAACFVGALGLLFYVIFSKQEVAPTIVRQGPPAASRDNIAVVSRLSQVRWAEGSEQRAQKRGQALTAGVVELESGLLQIDFYSGATVTLEGPARLELVNAELARLEHGNLWANVPPPAQGFRVESRSFDVLDLGTEFGMSVTPQGDGEVHVLDGEVEVYQPGQKVKGEEKLLTTGQALRVGADGRREAMASAPKRFQGTRRLDEEADRRRKMWTSYRDGLKQDPDVVLYYDFEENSRWARRLPNVAKKAEANTDGAIVGSEWGEGRWFGKQALQYRNPSDRVRLHLDGRFSSLTLVAWVRVDSLKNSEISLLHPETRQDRFIHWTLVNVNDQGEKMHAHFAESIKTGGTNEGRNHYHFATDLLRPAGSSLGEWMQLALVYNPAGNIVKQFQNGQLVGALPLKEKRVLEIGTADLGNWPYKEWAKDTPFEVRNLNGAIDEFIVIRRAWTEEEVLSHYQVGKP
ncbi:LamG-like jellyroll fold domain-containing protein [Roseibacillus ishigakijimensis]|uniref:FecR domain-containing protein n=1 Tax=Roseibacillus ishigakijimensis TaxID=454146 RepID=A0A934RJ63_9BACT|nr:LamG-like jellyroll fold domain-containing protein [Roseibacillus ishigakijimensis]MBK1832627.1 FecR domain-containing protein [Roseibacillus ishigakijimensis]